MSSEVWICPKIIQTDSLISVKGNYVIQVSGVTPEQSYVLPLIYSAVSMVRDLKNVYNSEFTHSAWQMICGAMSKYGTADLYFLSPWTLVSVAGFVELLQEKLKLHMDIYQGTIFMDARSNVVQNILNKTMKKHWERLFKKCDQKKSWLIFYILSKFFELIMILWYKSY